MSETDEMMEEYAVTLYEAMLRQAQAGNTWSVYWADGFDFALSGIGRGLEVTTNVQPGNVGISVITDDDDEVDLDMSIDEFCKMYRECFAADFDNILDKIREYTAEVLLLEKLEAD